MDKSDERQQTLAAELDGLRERVRELECELSAGGKDRPALVGVPESLAETFRQAEDYVRAYFADRAEDPARARIEYSGERYILIRAASLSTEFFDLVTSLYRDRGSREARSVAHGFQFDVAHALGKADAQRFHERMGVTDPVQKLSAGPVHFAFSGWASVVIHPESSPTPDENYFLTYDHPNSFEAEAWLKRGQKTDFPVCTMNSGYSSGWCEQSFGVPLVAAEVECRAMGAERCRFVMAPPSRIEAHLVRTNAAGSVHGQAGSEPPEVPEFFRRKRLEDELRAARDNLERRVAERTAELEWRNAELRLANERLEELHRAREEFVATVSHELRTPLVTGLGYLELLLAGKLGAVSDESRSGVSVAERNLRRLSSLLDDILSYHRLTSTGEGPPPEPAAFDLVALCQESVDDFLVRTDLDPGRIRLAGDELLPTAVADTEMIRRVLANLLDNAGRHAGERAHIEILIQELQGGRVRVSVRDDGAGMPAELLDQVTEPFVRHGTAKAGLGLGLAIVRSLLGLHGSRLTLRSEAGQGTEVSFVLPLSTAEAGAAELTGPQERPVLGLQPVEATGAVVLVVEDDDDTAEFVKLALAGEGYRVITAASAEQALDRLDEGPADLLLVDLSLPGMSGTDLCLRIKSDPATAGVPVYLFTARAEEAPRRAARAAGCDGYLVKPLSVEELLERVQEALSE